MRAVSVSGIEGDDGRSSRRFVQGSTRRPFAVFEDLSEDLANVRARAGLGSAARLPGLGVAQAFARPRLSPALRRHGKRFGAARLDLG
jgi:hypothetical protein